MYLVNTLNLIGETLIFLARQLVTPLAGCLTGSMGVFPLGEMLWKMKNHLNFGNGSAKLLKS